MRATLVGMCFVRRESLLASNGIVRGGKPGVLHVVADFRRVGREDGMRGAGPIAGSLAWGTIHCRRAGGVRGAVRMPIGTRSGSLCTWQGD